MLPSVDLHLQAQLRPPRGPDIIPLPPRQNPLIAVVVATEIYLFFLCILYIALFITKLLGASEANFDFHRCDFIFITRIHLIINYLITL